VAGNICLILLGCYIACIGKALEIVMLNAKYVLEYSVDFKRVSLIQTQRIKFCITSQQFLLAVLLHLL
jgi:hypothetical protein